MHLLLALKSLHDAGIVHRGKPDLLAPIVSTLTSLVDLNDGAILWNIKSMEGWTPAQLYECLGRPRKILLTAEEGGPAELVETKRFPLDMLTHPASLADFGHAIKTGTKVENTVQSPNMFCAPERFHGANPSFESDMWSYTFIFAQLYLGTEVIWGENRSLIDRLVQTLGPFPAAWKECYCGVGEPKDWWYDQLGQIPRPQLLGGVEALEAKIDRLRPEVCENEKFHALAVMRKGFCIYPERRITAAQLLEDPSFNAVMSYYRH
jgi:serine/threonine protein kinase